MPNKIYTVIGENNETFYVEADTEDDAFQKLSQSGKTDQREALKFIEGSRDNLPAGVEVI